MTGHQELKFSEKIGYGLGDAASNFFFQFFNIFLLFYYTDVFGISATAVGVMFIATKVIDAITDPAMGLIADRTNTRWGKFRPYILFGAIPYGVFGYLMFAGADFALSDNGKLIYAYITYSLMMVCYTVVNVPYSALMGVISSSSTERTKVASFRFFCAILAGWIIATFVTPLKNLLGGGDELLGYQYTIAIFAVISVALFWITFLTTKERIQPEQQKSNILSDLKIVFRNKPWVILFFVGIFALMSAAIRNGGLLYYFKYFVGDDGKPLFLIFDQTAIFMSTGMLAILAGILMTKTLTERHEKRNIMIVLSVLNALFFGSFLFIPSDQFGLMIALNCLGNLVWGPTIVIVWAMYADCADYGEWKTGRRTTGLIFSGIQFAHKLGLAVGAGLTGILLGTFGFIANQAQSDSAMLGIKLVFCVFPSVLVLLSAILLFFYQIDSSKIKMIEQGLKEKRKI